MHDADLTGAGMAGAIGEAGNTHVHVGCLVIGALVGIIVFHLLGFRFSGDVSVGR